MPANSRWDLIQRLKCKFKGKTYEMLLTIDNRGAKMWALRKLDENCVKSFETWYWRNLIVREQKINLAFMDQCITLQISASHYKSYRNDQQEATIFYSIVP